MTDYNIIRSSRRPIASIYETQTLKKSLMYLCLSHLTCDYVRTLGIVSMCLHCVKDIC